MNNSGFVVGRSPTDGSTDRAFIWHDDNGNNANDFGEMKELLPNGATGSAEDINNNGRVVGWIADDGDGGSTGGFAGFIWENNTFQLLAPGVSIKPFGINDAGAIVGVNSDTVRAFVLRSGVFTQVGSNRSVAYAVSEANPVHVVGTAALGSSDFPTHAFIWTDADGLKDLGTLSGRTNSDAYNIAIVSNSVQVVGTSYNDSSDARAFVWQDANGDGDGDDPDDAGEMKDLTTSISPVDSSWTVLQQARSINSSGQIVGYGLKTNGETHAFLLTPPSGLPSACLPTVNVSVSPAAVNEDGVGSVMTYTFTRSIVTASPLTVNFSVGGTADASTDYGQTGAATFTLTAGTVTIASGSATATVTVDPATDSAVETDETVVLTTTSGSGYIVGTPTSATGTITNDDSIPSVSVSVAPSAAAEDGATNLVYTFTRSSTAGTLTAHFSVSGTADPNTDYTQTDATSFTPPTGTVTFGAGSLTATVTVDPTADSTVELDETVILELTTGANYTIGSPSAATGTITNDDTDVIVTLSPLSVSESGTPNLVYTFTRAGVTTGALTVNFSVAGTATLNADYGQSGAASFTPPTGTVTFLAGSPIATVTLDPTPDSAVESDETVTLTVTTGAGYNVVSPSAATGTITDAPAIYVEAGTENNPIPNAFAVDSVTFARGPFRLVNDYNFSTDRLTRVILVTSPLGMTDPDLATGILSIHIAGYGQIPLANIEHVGPITGVAGLNASYIIVKLPAELSTLNPSPGPNNLTLTLKMGSVESNATTLSIIP